jgi:hypothetical protein
MAADSEDIAANPMGVGGKYRKLATDVTPQLNATPQFILAWRRIHTASEQSSSREMS